MEPYLLIALSIAPYFILAIAMYIHNYYTVQKPFHEKYGYPDKETLRRYSEHLRKVKALQKERERDKLGYNGLPRKWPN